ncbi:hypothetical protein [Escherichia fergusonii]|uniref:hypothetical protein n=1 Tax=Escherichia fergusonii TaxID=564 RepID=UPI001CBBF332|nr:hypothetical protein [Escherichia fergusonii]
MNLLITSVDGDKTAGAASVDIGEFYQVTIQHRKDISLALSAGKKYAIVLKEDTSLEKIPIRLIQRHIFMRLNLLPEPIPIHIS